MQQLALHRKKSKENGLGIDIEARAVQVLVERLSDDAGLFKDFIHRTDIPQRSDIRIEVPSRSIKERLFKAQNKKCKGCLTEFDIWNFDVDPMIPKSKGGSDSYGNYQLLCGNCNRIKGNRPMEYLNMKIRQRHELMRNEVTFG